LLNELKAQGGQLQTQSFTSGVTLEALIPEEAFEGLQARTLDLTRGRTCWTKKKEERIEASQNRAPRSPDLS
jgi:hypothetical protein